MIIALLSDMARSSGYSVDRGGSGFALGFVDQLNLRLVVLLVITRWQAIFVLAEGVKGIGVARGLDRAFNPGHQVAQELLGDEQAALELDDRLRRASKWMMWYEP